jgi:HPt (histidine-containing phosphotransfer) domain-containing protein
MQKLETTIIKWLPEKANGYQGISSVISNQSESAIDKTKNETCPVDVQVLRQLSEMQRPDTPNLLKRLISIFLDSSPTYLETIYKSIFSKDSQALRGAAHSLKSSSANIGAKALSGICLTLEQLGHEARIDEARSYLDELGYEYNRVKYYLEMYSSDDN